MAGKSIPVETLFILQNNLDSLSPRDAKRVELLQETAGFFGVSISTVRRALSSNNKPHLVRRKDYNSPRVLPKTDMKNFCEIISAMKLRTTNKKGRHLSTNECIRILEHYGVETPEGLIRAEKGVLKRATVDRYISRWGLSQRSIGIEPIVVPFEARHSNDCWQFDFSPSDLKKLEKVDKTSGRGDRTLMIASVVDDCSGVCYEEYHYITGEDTLTALKFLFNAMSPKRNIKLPFQGIPKMIYLDNGPIRRSKIFNRVMESLNIEIRSHIPRNLDGRRTTARSKGKVERQFRTVKDTFETLYHFHKPNTIEEANEWLHNYLLRYNDKKHRSRNRKRIEDWKQNLPPEGYRKMCTWDKFCSFARDPELRSVDSSGCVSVEGISYQLSSELAGQEVYLLFGLLDNELFVEYEGTQLGPFYPNNGPIPLGTFRKRKLASKEKKANRIEDLSKRITLPKSVMLSENKSIKKILSDSNVVSNEPTPFVPFVNGDVDILSFKNKTEAKAYISRYFGVPLATISSELLVSIDEVISHTLKKESVLNEVKRLMSKKEEGQCTEK